jgi:hypothetical protein
MVGNPFYGRGAYDERVRMASAVGADRDARMRMLKYAVVLATPLVFLAFDKLRENRR